MKLVAKAEAVMFATDSLMMKPVRSHMAARTWVEPVMGSVVWPGDQRSTWRMKKGTLTGQEKRSSLCRRTWELVAMQ